MQQADLINVIKAMIKAMQDARPELTKLDTAIGDGDHGINMARAFLEVEKKLPELEDKALADIVRQTGMTLAFKVGGASGPHDRLHGRLERPKDKEDSVSTIFPRC